MYYVSFRIKNFKGIKDTTVKLADQGKAGVFAFVGLNESGKTTILEAIHSFSPDEATSQVVGGEGKSGVPIRNRVPRHLLSSFSSDVSVSATVRLADDEKQWVIEDIKKNYGIIVNPESFPNDVVLEKSHRFLNGDYEESIFSVQTKIMVKTGRQQNWRVPTSEEKNKIRNEIYSHTPDIAYFPTFVFNFPKRIYLTTGRGDRISNFYMNAFQDILDYEGSGFTIEESIVRRVRSDEKKVSWLDFLKNWNLGDDKDKIQHVMDRASATVTEVVFGRWNKIFGEDAKGKEIFISFETLEGEKKNEQGNITKTNEHDLYVKFQIKDGTRRFDVNDRSLGFRWFFSFMLFTQFRVAREQTRPILFLFDEPASNLHAAAQQKLIECFPEIAKGDHTLAYTTHSHYMIEPKWLEQTFIVTNRADAPSGSVLEAMSMSDESLDIQSTRYREFIGQHPAHTSYFQPILDRLEVAPSKFDIDKSSILVEGKSDYYVLRYAAQLLKKDDLPILPGLGAGTFGALISLHLGWGIPLIALLDGDKKGKSEKERYVTEFGLREEQIFTLDECISGLIAIESLLDSYALNEIQKILQLNTNPTKNQIRRFFQENLAKDNIVSIGSAFESKVKVLIEQLERKLAATS